MPLSSYASLQPQAPSQPNPQPGVAKTLKEIRRVLHLQLAFNQQHRLEVQQQLIV